jgi:hypothetical protein
MTAAAFGCGLLLGGFGGCLAMAGRHARKIAALNADLVAMRDSLSVVQIIDADEHRDGPITANTYQRAKAIHDLETRLDNHIGA